MPRQGVEKVESDCHSWSHRHCLDTKKTVVLVVEANNTQDREAREEATEYSTMKKQKKETVDANIQRTLSSHWELLRVNERLQRLNDASNTTSQKKRKIAEQEVGAKTAMGELKLAHGSLRKALQNKHKSLTAPALPFEEVPLDVVEDCKEPTTEDIDGMLEAVLNRTRPTTDEDDEEAEDMDEDKDTD